MVPMHLGLTDGPFVPHNLISTQESPVPLLKFQMALRLKILMPSGTRNPDILFFSLKIPGKQIPSRVPKEKDTRLQGIFIYLKTYTKVPLNKSFFSLKGPKKTAPLHVP
jgi:hypothetical protein